MQDFLKGGQQKGKGLHAEKGGSSYGPNVKNPTSWVKRVGVGARGSDPLDPPRSAPEFSQLDLSRFPVRSSRR